MYVYIYRYFMTSETHIEKPYFNIILTSSNPSPWPFLNHPLPWPRILRCHLDDPVGAVGVHGASALWGLAAVGLFADGELPGIQASGGDFLPRIEDFAMENPHF